MTERQLKLEELKTIINNQKSNPLTLSFLGEEKLVKGLIESLYYGTNNGYRTKSAIKELADVGIPLEDFYSFMIQFFKTHIKNNTAFSSIPSIESYAPKYKDPDVKKKEKQKRKKIVYTKKEDKGRVYLQKFIQYLGEKLETTHPKVLTLKEVIDTVAVVEEIFESIIILTENLLNSVPPTSNNQSDQTSLKQYNTLKREVTKANLMELLIAVTTSNDVTTIEKRTYLNEYNIIKKKIDSINLQGVKERLSSDKKKFSYLEEIIFLLEERYTPLKKREFTLTEIRDEIQCFKKEHKTLKKMFGLPASTYIEIIYKHLNPKNYTLNTFKKMYYEE